MVFPLLEVAMEDVFVGDFPSWGVIIDILIVLKRVPPNVAISFFFRSVPMVSCTPTDVGKGAKPGFK
eukprot:9097471-Heterocapsa_arctica.AAC.1